MCAHAYACVPGAKEEVGSPFGVDTGIIVILEERTPFTNGIFYECLNCALLQSVTFYVMCSHVGLKGVYKNCLRHDFTGFLGLVH